MSLGADHAHTCSRCSADWMCDDPNCKYPTRMCSDCQRDILAIGLKHVKTLQAASIAALRKKIKEWVEKAIERAEMREE